MRGEKNHLRLVGSTPEVSVSVLGVRKDANVIIVRADNVQPGQVCEILHAGVFALSLRVTVPAGCRSITITTFALAQGRYEVSLRIDGTIESAADPSVVVVGSQRDRTMSTPASTRRPLKPRVGNSVCRVTTTAARVTRALRSDEHVVGSQFAASTPSQIVESHTGGA